MKRGKMHNIYFKIRTLAILLSISGFILKPVLAETVLNFQVKSTAAFFSSETFQQDLELFETEMKSKGKNVKVKLNNFVGSNPNYNTKQLLKFKSGDDVPDLCSSCDKNQ